MLAQSLQGGIGHAGVDGGRGVPWDPWDGGGPEEKACIEWGVLQEEIGGPSWLYQLRIIGYYRLDG